MATGKISAIRGVVVEVDFADEEIPEIYEALNVRLQDEGNLVLEVQQHLGSGLVSYRCDGFYRWFTPWIRRGSYWCFLSVVPVWSLWTLGRIFDVVGNAIDGHPTPEAETYYPIHREAPEFQEQSTEIENV